MDLRGALLRLSVPRCFLVSSPGGTGVRLAVEAELRRRGWREAVSPADADILIVCGGAAGPLTEAIDRVWVQIPRPRARVEIQNSESAAWQLDEAKHERRDLVSDTQTRLEMHMGADASANLGMGRDTGGHAKSHSNMDMDMQMPGGLAMADRGPDRDGLKLDQLHVSLGPALADWPSGLLVRVLLQGDVVQAAEPALLDLVAPSSFWVDVQSASVDHSRFQAAASADSLQRFLNLAGWRSAGSTVRWLRDALLSDRPGERLDRRFTRCLQRVRSNKLLGRSTRGLGVADAVAPATLRGDVRDRYLRWTEQLLSTVACEAPQLSIEPAEWALQRASNSSAALSMLPSLLVGKELATARLVIASFDPDIETITTSSFQRADGQS